MKTISIPIAALGILTSVSTAYAEDACNKKDKQDTFSVAKEIASYAWSLGSVFLGNISAVSDVKDKLSEILDLESKPPTLDKVLCVLDTHLDQVYNGLHFDIQWSILNDAANDAEDSNFDLRAGHDLTQTDDQRSKDAAKTLARDGPANPIFHRPYDKKKDKDLMDLLNKTCMDKGCFYNKDDLIIDAGKDMVYDWRLGLPPLLMYISQRLQMIAKIYPDYFLSPGGSVEDKLLKEELNDYRKALKQHYEMISDGIKCGRDVCAEIHTGYQVPAGNLLRYAVYRDLPLFELKAMIDALYLYTQGPMADLAQNYHRLPLDWEPGEYCLESATAGEFGYSVYVSSCIGTSTQQWVYDRAKGTIKNSGSVVDPASGQCLGVIGGAVNRGMELQVIASNCADDPNNDKDYYNAVHRLQQWTYDPESKFLLNGTGTVLRVHSRSSPISVSAAPYIGTPEYKWRADNRIAGKPPFSDTMRPGEAMWKGQSRVSHNNAYELILQTDGNLVLYEKCTSSRASCSIRTTSTTELPVPRWSSGTKGRAVDSVIMQTDGNLVIYPPSSCSFSSLLDAVAPYASSAVESCGGRLRGIWQTYTRGHNFSHLRVEDNGSVVIYDQNSSPIWTGP
jgi:hypothetical protein